jgi:pyruvate dehydrogenase E2 component (dihydrolipoamide acetyltransferase)
MADGVVSKWLKQVGDSVSRGEPLFEVESDKVTTEVEAPSDGIIRQIRVPEGVKVDVGTILAVIGRPEEVVQDTNGGSHITSSSPTSAIAVAAPPISSPPEAPTKLFVTPRARKVADELGVDLNQVRGTGPAGRILERDVLAAAPVAPSTPVVPSLPISPPVAPVVPAAATVQPLAGMRRTIAERMLRSQQTVAEVTITAEADMTEVAKLRQQVGPEWERQYGLKVSYTEVIVKAVARALVEHPRLNSSLGEDGIRLHSDVNVGVAVALDEGLIVPVVHRADQKPLIEISRAVRDLSERARTNRLSRDDVSGGTFTISNLGTLGVETFTPIINWPECAILGVGRIGERAVVRDGQVVVRPTMWLSLTFDHRIVDGAPAAQFLARVRQLLESPYLLFV